MTGRVLVTGANGFVGVHVCEAFARAGWDVIGATRRPVGDTRGTIRRVVLTDLTETSAIRPALKGVDVLVHAAGLAHVQTRHPNDAARFTSSNVTTPRSICEAAVAERVRHVLVISSVAVFGEGGSAKLAEDAPASPTTLYGRSKLDGEMAATLAVRGTSTRVSIIRPPMMYGAGMRGNPLTLFRLLGLGLPLPLGGITNRRSQLYVGNLADALIALASNLDAVPGSTSIYHVADREVLSTPDFVRLAASALGRDVTLLPCPAAVLRVGAALVERGGRMVDRDLQLGVVNRLLESFELDTSRLELDTGYRPHFSVSEGLSHAARWYRASRGVQTDD